MKAIRKIKVSQEKNYIIIQFENTIKSLLDVRFPTTLGLYDRL